MMLIQSSSILQYKKHQLLKETLLYVIWKKVMKKRKVSNKKTKERLDSFYDYTKNQARHPAVI